MNKILVYMEQENEKNKLALQYCDENISSVFDLHEFSLLVFSEQYELIIMNCRFEHNLILKTINLIKASQKYAKLVVISNTLETLTQSDKQQVENSCDFFFKGDTLSKEILTFCIDFLIEDINSRYYVDESNKIIIHGNEVIYDNVIVQFTNKEIELLFYFLKHKNKTLTRLELYTEVWENSNSHKVSNSIRIVDATIKNMRKKLPQLSIKSIYRKGYIFVYK